MVVYNFKGSGYTTDQAIQHCIGKFTQKLGKAPTICFLHPNRIPEVIDTLDLKIKSDFTRLEYDIALD